MSKLKKTYFFQLGSEGGIITNSSPTANLTSQKRKPLKFKNDGTSLVVQNLHPSTTTSTLKSLVENCIHCEIMNKTIKRITDEEVTYTFAFMSFPSTTSSFVAKCTLHERVVDGNSLIVKNKQSYAQRQAEIAAFKQARKQEQQRQRQEERRQQRKEYFRQQREEQREQRRQEQSKRTQERKYTKQQSNWDEEQNRQVQESKQQVRQEREAFRKLLQFRNTDWNCPKCSKINFTPRTHCFGCKTERIIPKEVLEAEKKHQQQRRERREQFGS